MEGLFKLSVVFEDRSVTKVGMKVLYYSFKLSNWQELFFGCTRDDLEDFIIILAKVVAMSPAPSRTRTVFDERNIYLSISF